MSDKQGESATWLSEFHGAVMEFLRSPPEQSDAAWKRVAGIIAKRPPYGDEETEDAPPESPQGTSVWPAA